MGKRIATLLLLVGTTVLAGCRAQIKVESRRSSPAALATSVGVGVPVEIADGLSPTRQYFQSRSVMALHVKSDDFAPGDDVSLVDETTGANLIDHEALTANLTDEATTASLTDVAGELSIKLYPALPAYKGHLAFAGNQLRLTLNDDTKPQFAQSTVYLHDFPYFSLATARFSGNRQQVNGLQGSIDTFLSPMVTNGVGTLTTGVVATLNH